MGAQIAGIEDGASLRQVHLWPPKKAKPSTIKSQFWKGIKFHTAENSKLSIYDLPPKTVVVLHCDETCRVQVSTF